MTNTTTTDTATRRTRIERLLGLDETKGVRGDLARAIRSKALGHTVWVRNEPIDQAIADLSRMKAHYEKILAELA